MVKMGMMGPRVHRLIASIDLDSPGAAINLPFSLMTMALTIPPLS